MDATKPATKTLDQEELAGDKEIEEGQSLTGNKTR